MAARDIIQAAAGAAGATEAVYVEDVFSTYLYTGTGASQTITNGIDLNTKGGLVWLKGRSGATDHALYDTARGATYDIGSNLTSAQTTQSTGLTAFGTTGFTLGALAKLNTSAATYTSWTFRKQPKFFDIVTYTGDGQTQRTISHNLGVQPGMVIAKATSEASDWVVFHRSANTNVLKLNATDAGLNLYPSYNSQITSTYITAWKNSATYDAYSTNKSGVTYVAYLFAHDAGGFGAAGTDSVVSCGSYTTNSAASATVSLGWEPQFLLIKRTDSTGNWRILDVMRGNPNTSGGQQLLYPNLSNAELGPTSGYGYPTATGFQVDSDDAINAQFIYLAIRRGPMKTPTDATKVFAPVVSSGSRGYKITTGFPVDVQLAGVRSGYGMAFVMDRIRGVATDTSGNPIVGLSLQTSSTAAESAISSDYYSRGWDNTGFQLANLFAPSFDTIYWNFRRAPGFFDSVCYTGTGSANAVAHNLGVAPELWIVKRRSLDERWVVGSTTQGSNVVELNSANGQYNASGNYFGNGTSYVAPSSSVITVGSSHGATNASGSTYVAYLFATCPGVSKVGSYTGSGTTKQIDCGFAAGARFVLIKRTDSTGDWYTWDSSRGIVSGNDPYLLLNSTAAEVTNTDYIDPYSAGFEISSSAPAAINASGGTFIFLAVA